ncbi:MAG: D-glycerate dehydrogenase [Patescibacteria group bacterium]|nr:D-glycerate dehydrogenase [Patescibacteria group bacterium]MDE2172332.1 D-glycerate dehydrogenase [Patescibacteria group bacterium]
MKSVFVTRKIPENGLLLLRRKGYDVEVSAFDRPLSKAELISRLKSRPYDAVLSLLNDRIDAEVFEAAPTVKIFANYTIGFDNFDVEEGKKRGVYLTNAPGGGADRVAEHVWALALTLTCHVTDGNAYMRAGAYTGWDPMLMTGMKIAGKVLGLVGAGRIGTEVARIGALGFGMRVIYYDVVRNQKIEELEHATYYEHVEDVIKQADIISLHVPLLPATEHLIDAGRLAMMKKTAYLINTSRGPVIDEAALVAALRSGVIAGAGLDVFEHEPALTPGLADLPNVVMTPHIASSTVDSREDMSRIAAENIIQALEGAVPANLVYHVDKMPAAPTRQMV